MIIHDLKSETAAYEWVKKDEIKTLPHVSVIGEGAGRMTTIEVLNRYVWIDKYISTSGYMCLSNFQT
jgi:hypothetical protein